jgi:crotonobetainyl-CoA:carnitine CoA-transferase CaiB-like acyl-CoA transferase
MLDTAVAARTLQLVPALADASTAFATTVLAGATPCYGVYVTRDGRFGALGALEPKFWEKFCAAVGKPDWAVRGHEPGGDLKLELASLFAERTLDEWRTLLEPAGCCFAPALEPREVPGDPQVRARGLILEDQGRPARVAPPVRLGGTPARPSLRAPARAGQDTTEVLERVLGLSGREIDGLRAKGALGTS